LPWHLREKVVMEPSVGRQSLAEFEKTYPDEPRCAACLFKQRWRDDFECPGCGGSRAAFLKSRAYTYECLDCGRQTSIAAGTVMHRSKQSLTMWFSAAHFLATYPLGISTRQLQKRPGITYQTAWLLKKNIELSNSDRVHEMPNGLVDINHPKIFCRQLIGRPQRSTVAVAFEVFEDWAAQWNPSPDLRPNSPVWKTSLTPPQRQSKTSFGKTWSLRPRCLQRAASHIWGSLTTDTFRMGWQATSKNTADPEVIKNWLRSHQKLGHDFVEDGLVQIAAHLNWRSLLDTVLRLDHTRSYWDIIGRDNPRKGIPTIRRRPWRRKTATGMREDGSGRG
jgi:predicted RNA-binding Zn-ribbon protein involved in translation (DUF1610 family)